MWLFEGGFIYIYKDMVFEDTIYFTGDDRGHANFVIPYLDLVVVHWVYEKGIYFWNHFKEDFQVTMLK